MSKYQHRSEQKGLVPVNERKAGDCGYVCHCGDKQVALYAKSLYRAQLAAANYFGVKEDRRYLVSCMLAENEDGSTYAQSTAQFG